MSESGSPPGEPVNGIASEVKELLNDERWMRQKYVEEGLSYSELGDMLDIAPSSVYRYAQKHDIESRSPGEYQSYDRLQDEVWLREKYVDEDLSVSEIAELVGCGTTTVDTWRRKHDIPPKTVYTGIDERLKDTEWLREMYVEKELPTKEIADQIGEDQSNVYRSVVRAGIETRPQGFQCGEDHFNWKGGHDRYYGANWHQQRQKALERDDYTCQRCGVEKQPDERQLSIHHREPLNGYKRKYDAPEWWERGNRLENLITLCQPCHAKWELVPLKFDLR